MSYQTVTEDSLFRAEQRISSAEQGNLKSLFSLTYTALRSGRIGAFRRRGARRSLVPKPRRKANSHHRTILPIIKKILA